MPTEDSSDPAWPDTLRRHHILQHESRRIDGYTTHIYGHVQTIIPSTTQPRHWHNNGWAGPGVDILSKVGKKQKWNRYVPEPCYDGAIVENTVLDPNYRDWLSSLTDELPNILLIRYANIYTLFQVQPLLQLLQLEYCSYLIYSATAAHKTQLFVL